MCGVRWQAGGRQSPRNPVRQGRRAVSHRCAAEINRLIELVADEVSVSGLAHSQTATVIAASVRLTVHGRNLRARVCKRGQLLGLAHVLNPLTLLMQAMLVSFLRTALLVTSLPPVGEEELQTTTTNKSSSRQKRTAAHSESPRQTKTGFSHSTPTHWGGHLQNRSRRRQVCRGKHTTGPHPEQPFI